MSHILLCLPPNFQVQADVPHQPFFVSENHMNFPFGMSAELSFVLSQFTRVTDRRFAIRKTALHKMQRCNYGRGERNFRVNIMSNHLPSEMFYRAAAAVMIAWWKGKRTALCCNVYHPAAQFLCDSWAVLVDFWYVAPFRNQSTSNVTGVENRGALNFSFWPM